jgi:hypothetical protein
VADETVEHSLDDVAASMLVKPAEAKPTPKAAPAEVANEEDTQNDDVGTGEEVSGTEDTETPETTDTEATEEDDVELDEIDIDLTVDGEEKKVKLKDLKANYSGNAAIEKRLQEATEAKNHAVRANQVLFTALNEEAQRLKKIDEILIKISEPEEINWEELRNTNLPKYLLERDKQRETNERRSILQQEQLRIQNQQREIAQKAQAEYTQNEAKQLIAKIPDFAEPEKAQVLFSKLTDAGKNYGFTPEEVGGVMDHRMMLVLRDAMLYREQANKQKAVAAKQAPVSALLRPSASKATTPGNQIKKAQEKIIAKARSTGKVDDVAAMLLVRKK